MQLKTLLNRVHPVKGFVYVKVRCCDVMRSRLESLKVVANGLLKPRQLIVNWFVAKKQYNAGIVEGLNANVKLRFRQAYGFRTFEVIEVMEILSPPMGEAPAEPLFSQIWLGRLRP